MGQYTTDVLFRDASIQNRNPSIMKIPVIPGRSIVYVRWIVIGEGSGRVVVDCVKGGQAHMELTIAPRRPPWLMVSGICASKFVFG